MTSHVKHVCVLLLRLLEVPGPDAAPEGVHAGQQALTALQHRLDQHLSWCYLALRRVSCEDCLYVWQSKPERAREAHLMLRHRGHAVCLPEVGRSYSKRAQASQRGHTPFSDCNRGGDSVELQSNLQPQHRAQHDCHFWQSAG